MTFLRMKLLMLFIISAGICYAGEITVGTGGDYNSITEALEGKTGGNAVLRILDELHFECGIIINRNVKITGAGMHQTVIAGSNEREGASDRVFFVTESGRLELRDLAVSHGKPSSVPLCGGGIANEGYLLMQNCAVSDNDAVYGAGIFNRGRSELYNCVISGNRTYRAPLDIIRSGVGCMGSGAGIKTESECELYIENCAFIDNCSVRSGGGLYVACGCDAVIRNSLFYGNSCAKRGGGLCNKGDVTLEHVTVARNQSVQRGSGFCNMGKAAITASLLAENSYGDFALIAAHGMYSEGFLTENTGNLCSDGSLEGAVEADARLKQLSTGSDSVPYLGIGWFSPARNALIRSDAYTPETDMRGVPRDIRPDIGSYEFRLISRRQ